MKILYDMEIILIFADTMVSKQCDDKRCEFISVVHDAHGIQYNGSNIRECEPLL